MEYAKHRGSGVFEFLGRDPSANRTLASSEAVGLSCILNACGRISAGAGVIFCCLEQCCCGAWFTSGLPSV